MKAKKITFVGAGNMARALIVGLLGTGYPAECLTASNPPNPALDAFQQQFGIQLVSDNCAAIKDADVIVLCVKPKVLPEVCQEIKAIVSDSNALVISVAAGITVDHLSQWLSPSLPIIRSMPNTPAAVSAGATGLFANENTTEAQKDLAEELFRAVGVTVWVEEEDKLNLITAASGSGPAYYFLMIEAMEEAAMDLGLTEKDARLLSLQTVLGAAKMAMESMHDVHELRASVTSPNGTTEAAISAFEKAGFKQIVKDAVSSALERSRELAQEIKKE